MPAPDHLTAFSAVDGSTVWSDDIGISWGSIALAGGLVFAGTQETTDFFVYDATTGTRLKTFGLPSKGSIGGRRHRVRRLRRDHRRRRSPGLRTAVADAWVDSVRPDPHRKRPARHPAIIESA